MTTNTNGKETILELIKKLMAHTVENGATEAEAQLFMQHAQKLMFEHNLEMVDVQDYDLPDKGASKIEKDTMHLPDQGYNQPKEWKFTLAFGVAEYNFCKGLVGYNHVSFVGRKQDVEVVKELYIWILEQAEKIAKEETEKFKVKSKRYQELSKKFHNLQRIHQELGLGESMELHTLAREGGMLEHPMRWKNNFLHGLVDRVNSRLYEQWMNLKKSTEKSTALVVVTETAIKEWMDEKYPKIKNHTGPEISYYGGGYTEGNRAGNRVSLVRPSKQIDS